MVVENELTDGCLADEGEGQYFRIGRYCLFLIKKFLDTPKMFRGVDRGVFEGWFDVTDKWWHQLVRKILLSSNSIEKRLFPFVHRICGSCLAQQKRESYYLKANCLTKE